MTISITVETERPSLKAFKEYMCNRYRVKTVNDLPMSVNEYADFMQAFEAGWSAKEKEMLDKMLERVGKIGKEKSHNED